MADQSPNPNPNPSPETQQQQQPTTPRTDYRKGNWTVMETLTLITAKRLDDDRRSAAASSASPVGRSAEQRWKWVENYCCAHGCLRSQNQCNDKWDNLLRDYKKVRDFESRIAAAEPVVGAGRKSYWEMERHERKEFNLPTNMGFDIHEALTDVLNRRNARRMAVFPTPVMMLPPPPLPQPPKAASSHPPAVAQAGTQTEDSGAGSEESEEEEPELKRRKVRDLGMSIVRTATMLSQTLMSCEEKKEQRHREMMELEERRLRLEERRLKLEEERSKKNEQAVAGLLAAVNGLSNAVHALVSEQRRTGDGGLM